MTDIKIDIKIVTSLNQPRNRLSVWTDEPLSLPIYHTFLYPLLLVSLLSHLLICLDDTDCTFIL